MQGTEAHAITILMYTAHMHCLLQCPCCMSVWCVFPHGRRQHEPDVCHSPTCPGVCLCVCVCVTTRPSPDNVCDHLRLQLKVHVSRWVTQLGHHSLQGCVVVQMSTGQQLNETRGVLLVVLANCNTTTPFNSRCICICIYAINKWIRVAGCHACHFVGMLIM